MYYTTRIPIRFGICGLYKVIRDVYHQQYLPLKRPLGRSLKRSPGAQRPPLRGSRGCFASFEVNIYPKGPGTDTMKTLGSDIGNYYYGLFPSTPHLWLGPFGIQTIWGTPIWVRLEGPIQKPLMLTLPKCVNLLAHGALIWAPAFLSFFWRGQRYGRLVPVWYLRVT